MSKAKLYFRNEKTTDVWLTPPEIPGALGSFDLDPAAPEWVPNGFRYAPFHYTEALDGLVQPWFGRVWLNPPYGKMCGPFMQKLANHGNGIALIFARAETRWFKSEVWDRANAVFFFTKRIQFYNEFGFRGDSASAPSCLVAYGEHNVDAIKRSGLVGTLVRVEK